MKRAFVIFNPVAGKSGIKQHLFALIDNLSKLDYLVTIYPTKARGDGEEKVSRLECVDLLVVSGGDGTLREIVSGYVKNEKLFVPILYLPTGTTNDFARTLNLSKTFEKNLALLVQGKVMPIDIGRFNDAHFVYVAAFGAFTEVSYTTPQINKNMLGHLAYVLEGITQLSQIKGFSCEIKWEQGCISGEFLFGGICNSDSIGGMKRRIGPKSQLNDGYFEAAFVRKPNQLQDLPKLIAQLVSGEDDGEQIIILQTKTITITAKEPIHWTLDGEDGGFHQVVRIENLYRVVEIIVPQ